MKTKTIGEILKEERQFHHLSIEELAKRTRIRPEYLAALEQNHFDELPAAAFVKGYIKTYSRIFGFDSQPLLALLRRDFKESAKGQLVPREFIKPLIKRRHFWTPVTNVAVVVALLFATLIMYVGIQWYNFSRPPLLELTTPEEGATVASQVEVKGKTVPEAIVVVNNQPVALQANGTFETVVFMPREGITTLTVESRDRRGKVNLVQRTVYVRF